jgi:cytochrome c oxidase subunit III
VIQTELPTPVAPATDAVERRPAQLAHHFQTLPQQFDASKLGMWLFLATEVLLFGGLFCAYAVARGNHPELFEYGHRYLDTGWGAINTVVLIFSSFTMAMAVWAAQNNQRRDLVMFLALTLLGGVDFLGIKLIEYSHKMHDNLTWGAGFYHDPEAVASSAAPSAGPTSPPPPAPPVKAGDLAKGRDLFRNTCAACHGLRGEGIAGQGKDMRGSEFIGKLDDAGLLAFIQRGRMPNESSNTTGRMMPPRGGNSLLTDENLLDAIAYVREIQQQAPGATAAPSGPGVSPSPSNAAPDSAAGAAVEVYVEKTVIPPAPPGPPGLSAGWDQPPREPEHGTPPPNPRRDPQRPRNLHIFFGLYFCMTGLHGLHVIAGLAVIAYLLVGALRGQFSSAYFTPVDLGGLYWHLVDLIWIFLFPLLYLIH